LVSLLVNATFINGYGGRTFVSVVFRPRP